MKNKNSLTVLVLVVFMVGGSCAEGSEYLHPKVKTGEKSIKKVLVLPPKVQFVKTGIKGGEPMYREGERVEPAILRLVSRAFRENGFDTSEDLLTPEALAKNHELRTSLASLQSRYDVLNPKLFKNGKDIKKGRFSLGDSISDFDPAASADALVFIRSQGMALTGGKQAFGLLVGGATRSRIDMTLTVVDTRTGEVLYLSKFFSLGNFIEHPEEVLGKKISKAIKKLREGKL